MNCGFCKQATECSRKECFHFPESTEGFISLDSRDQQFTGLRSLTSLRTVLSGTCIYRAGGQEYRISEGEYLLLNEGDDFDLTILDQETSLITVCFDQYRAIDIHRATSQPDSALLSGFESEAGNADVRFPHGLSRNPAIVSRLHSMLHARSSDQGTFDEIFSDLLQELVVAHSKEIKSISDLTAKQPSVRVEIQRRLSQAIDFIDSNLLEQIDVERMATAAAMSKHHFIRSFKQAHGKTPYRYLIERRLRASRADLHAGDRSITSIAQKYQFADVQSFSKSFKQLFHLPPSMISKQQ